MKPHYLILNQARFHAGLAYRSSGLSATLLLAISLLLASCGSSDDNNGNNPNLPGQDIPIVGQPPDKLELTAFVATRAPDYLSGRIDRLSLDEGNIVTGSLPPTLSDISVETDGQSVYQIGRFNIDSFSRFDADDLSLVYQRSVLGDAAVSANPIDVAFIDDTKAYLTRRGSDKLWIINPSAETEADFKLGEIDLGAYDTDLPNMTDAIIVDNKLFVLMETLTELPNGQQPAEKPGFVAVFNTLTDQEIDTRQSGNDLNGIALEVVNPTALQYNEATGQIYVLGRGNYFESPLVSGDFHTGGIEVIDPTTYQNQLLLDDGTDSDNNGYFLNMAVVDANTAFLVTLAGYDPVTFAAISTLRQFNPTTGELLATPVEGLTGIDISTLAVGPDNHLWIGISDNTPGFERIDLSTLELAEERVRTELVPSNVVFLAREQ